MKKQSVVLIFLLELPPTTTTAEISGQSRIVPFLSVMLRIEEVAEHFKEMVWLSTLTLDLAGFSGGAFQWLPQALPDNTLHFKKDWLHSRQNI